MNNLLHEITNCPNIEKARLDANHPCHKIVNTQPRDNFQLPEPWNGNIVDAPILFISSNPSFDDNEYYPTTEWKKEVIEDFFCKSVSRKNRHLG